MIHLSHFLKSFRDPVNMDQGLLKNHSSRDSVLQTMINKEIMLSTVLYFIEIVRIVGQREYVRESSNDTLEKLHLVSFVKFYKCLPVNILEVACVEWESMNNNLAKVIKDKV